MSYEGNASSVISKKNDINNVVTNVNNLDFEGVWKSQASEKLLSSLDSIMSKANTEMSNLQAYADALKMINECIAIDQQIADLSARLASIDTTTEEGAARAAEIQAQINQLKAQKASIVSQIKSIVSSFVSINAEYSMAFTGISAASWNELVQMSEEFSKLPTGDLLKALTIYDDKGNVIRDGGEYVEGIIDSIKEKYTGVERNYYVSRAIIELSLEAGVRVPYEHNGTASTGKTIDTRLAVPTAALSRGVDCNALASYIIFGEDSTEKWLEVGQYKNAGQAVTSYEQMQSGDIFANGKHVGMIIANNPETGEALILHASGHDPDMRFEKVNYNYFDAKGHEIRRVDSNYVSPNLANILNVDTTNYTPSSSNINISTANYVPSTSSVKMDASANNNVSLSANSYNYKPDVSVGSINSNGNVYNGQPLNAPQGINRNGPTASETWYDLPMSGVVKNMEKLYGYTDLEASIRDDGVKVLSGVTPDGERFENLVMVAADVEHMSNPDGTFERGEIVATSLGTGIVVDACGRSISERKSTGNVHFDIATAWGTGEYKEAAYADYNNAKQNFNAGISNYSDTSTSVNVDTPSYTFETSNLNIDTSNNNNVSLSTNSYNYTPDVSVGSVNMNGDVYNGQALTAPQGINRNGPTASETWYDLPMSGVVRNMEKLYGYTDLEASIRDDGVKVLSGLDANGQRFDNLVMVAADVEHMSNPDGTFARGEIVETSLGTGIVVDACGRSISERKSTGNVHFDIATAWGTGEYKEAAYAKKD